MKEFFSNFSLFLIKVKNYEKNSSIFFHLRYSLEHPKIHFGSFLKNLYPFLNAMPPILLWWILMPKYGKELKNLFLHNNFHSLIFLWQIRIHNFPHFQFLPFYFPESVYPLLFWMKMTMNQCFKHYLTKLRSGKIWQLAQFYFKVSIFCR